MSRRAKSTKPPKASQVPERLATIKGADFVAGQISNPLHRLRFLQAVMPVVHSAYLSRKSRVLIAVAAAGLLLTVPESIPRLRPSDQARSVSRVVSAGPANVRLEPVPEIWLVEKTAASETYSNGLRIDNRFTVGTHPRSYVAFSAKRPDDLQGERRTEPAGIVFHTTESLQVPFEPENNARIKDVGTYLLDYIQKRQAYNYLIDRFGRVYRVVRESDVANHAGFSIWADDTSVYVNLNASFLAVSFETRTSPGQDAAAVNPAQVHSAALLTDMLRRRFRIDARNCVTHAQVSVNPSNMKIGYHIDWASSFPFEQMNLPDNYSRPLPAVSVAGFDFDTNFENRAGARVYQEAQLADEILRNRAAEAHVDISVYRKELQQRYRQQLALVRSDENRADDEE